MPTKLPTAMPERNFDLTRSSMCSCITLQRIAQLCTNMYKQCPITLAKIRKRLATTFRMFRCCLCGCKPHASELQTTEPWAIHASKSGRSCADKARSSLRTFHTTAGSVSQLSQRSPPQTHDRLRTRQKNPESRSLHHLHGATAYEDRSKPACLHHVAHIDRLGNGAVLLVSCCTND